VRLRLHPASTRSRVQSTHIMDYGTFKERFGLHSGETELHMLEKFYAAHFLAEQGFSRMYVEATLQCVPRVRQDETLYADVCGEDNDEFTIVFCETTPPSTTLYEGLKLVNAAENSRAFLLYPFKVNVDVLADRFPEAFESGKIMVEQFCWLDSGLEEAFREALELMDLLANETRVRMLMPLLERPYRKGYYRREINPKLVYENISSLLTRGLINELPEDEYQLSSVGRRILCEYITFLERVKRVLEESG